VRPASLRSDQCRIIGLARELIEQVFRLINSLSHELNQTVSIIVLQIMDNLGRLVGKTSYFESIHDHCTLTRTGETGLVDLDVRIGRFGELEASCLI
jgi:hypothetical protein